MTDIWQLLANGFAQVTGILLVLACAVLWLRRRTPWLLLALLAQLSAMLCRLLFSLSTTVFADVPALRVVWPLASCLFAIGLLGHAWFETLAIVSDGVQESRP